MYSYKNLSCRHETLIAHNLLMSGGYKNVTKN